MKNTAQLLPLLAVLPSWISGWWAGDIDGVRMEVGMHRDVLPGGKTAFEFLRIEEKDGKVVYRSMPGGRPVTAHHLLEEGRQTLRPDRGDDAGKKGCGRMVLEPRQAVS